MAFQHLIVLSTDEGYNGEFNEFGIDEVPWQLDVKGPAWVEPARQVEGEVGDIDWELEDWLEEERENSVEGIILDQERDHYFRLQERIEEQRGIGFQAGEGVAYQKYRALESLYNDQWAKVEELDGLYREKERIIRKKRKEELNKGKKKQL